MNSVRIKNNTAERKKIIDNEKAVFFDIDGTLWDFKMNIPESTKKH